MDKDQNKILALLSKLRSDAQNICELEYKAMVNFTNSLLEQYKDQPKILIKELKKLQY